MALMVTSTARIPTDRPDRYLRQICEHAGAMGSGGHGPGDHAGHQSGHGRGQGTAASEVQVSAECAATQGTITFAPWGSCEITAGPDALTLRVEAGDAQSLRRMQEVLTGDLERFGRRDGLSVTWQD